MGSIVNPLWNRSRPVSAASGGNEGGKTKRGSTSWDMERDVPHDYRRRIGARIRDMREQAGMTQRELAQHLGMSNTGVSAMELGRSVISPEHYTELSDIFGIDKEEWGKFLLKFTNPWLYGLLYGVDVELKRDLAALPKRIGR